MLLFLYRRVLQQELGEIGDTAAYLFPGHRRSVDPSSSEVRRHQFSESSVQNAVVVAIRDAGIEKSASCHTFRHSFATHLV